MSVKLLVNSRLLVVQILGSESYSHTQILDWEEGLVPLISVLFKKQL